MTGTALQVVRLVVVVALVCVAGALATPPGRLPLALRGLQRLMRKDRGEASDAAAPRASVARRLLAFVLVLAALALALV